MLPITRVVLYKHGVGFFERRGAVTGTTSVDLHFKAGEMNDVLKSLTTMDLGNGIVSSVSYESVKPIERQLEEVAVSLGDTDAVSGLLNQVKGARVAIEIGGKAVEGTVLGVETVARAIGESIINTPRVAILAQGSSVQSFDLLEVKSVTLLDESLRKDVQHLLDILISSKKKDLKKLTIFAHGEGTRDLAVSYIVETPVWKTSYRLLLGDGEGEDPRPILQGWAIVDNTQDEDWENVRLSLVAGLPISFVHDLYAPRYKRRPVVEVREEAAYGPPMLESAVESFADASPPAFAPPPGFGGPPGAAPPPPPPTPSPAKARARMVGTTHVQTRTVEVGDLFHYDIENPVTVRRGQSALVPILQGPIEGSRVAVYNAEVRGKNPMSAVLFKNTTGATLEGGPVTVLEGLSYVGEAMLDTLKPNDEKLVPFSVELGTTVSIDPQSDLTGVTHSRISNGYLYLTRYRLERRIYVINHKGDKPLTLFLEHRFNSGWEVLESESSDKPVERTENFYRFKLTCPPEETTRFTVVERGDQTETRAITQVGRDEVSVWLTSRWIDDHTRQVLFSLIDLRDQIHELARKVQQREQTIAEIFHNQERVRANLGALGASQDERGLRERYVAEMSFDEDRLKELREEVRRDKTLRESLEHDLRERLTSLSFAASV